MNYSNVNYSRGQVKIQQMAFVLVAIMIFFAIVVLFYLSIRVNLLKGDVEILRNEEAKEVVRKLAGRPELSWTVTDCASCIDLDKALVLNHRESYEDFWEVPFLQIERVYPDGEGECTKGNYPDCRTITLVDEGIYIAHSAFVALCRHDELMGDKCELGKIYLGFRSVG